MDDQALRALNPAEAVCGDSLSGWLRRLITSRAADEISRTRPVLVGPSVSRSRASLCDHWKAEGRRRTYTAGGTGVS